jgi:hypothetical protein
MNKETQSTAQEKEELKSMLLTHFGIESEEQRELIVNDLLNKERGLLNNGKSEIPQRIYIERTKDNSAYVAQVENCEVGSSGAVAYGETEIEAAIKLTQTLVTKGYRVELSAHQFKQSPSDAQNDLQAELQKQIQEPQSGYVQTEYLPQNQISNVAWQGHLVKLNSIHCTCPYCSKDFDIQPALNTLIMRSHEMDAGQPSNVKEERL